MSNNCLSIFPEQPLERITLDAWQIMYASREEGITRGLQLGEASTDTSVPWTPHAVPGLLRATPGRDTVWYRCVFQHSQKLPLSQALLRFNGCFLEAQVWLNGHELGDHYGYFAPWSLNATKHLREGANTLVVCVQSPAETGNLHSKLNIMGVFNDWDCKPYPNNAAYSLPPDYEWWVPLGFWAPVTLDLCGPVIVEAIHLIPQFPDGRWRVIDGRLQDARGRVMLRMRLRNMTQEPQRLRLSVDIRPDNFNDGWSYTTDESLLLSPGQASDLGMVVEIPQPALWFPWSQGAPNLYRCSLMFKWGGRSIALPPLMIVRTFGMREIQARISPNEVDGQKRGWEWWLNGKRIFPKGSNYITDFLLDRATPDRFRQDIELAREANMDILRLHAHIAPTDFYQIADETGMLVFSDFPLIFSYAFRRGEEAHEWVQQKMMDQLPEMIDLLQTHPSIILWCVHNEPPWPDMLAWFGESHQAQNNKELDEAGKRLLELLDPTRPVIAASGDMDEHIYNGWYWSTLAEARDLRPIFPTEFGAQALPDRDSPFWEQATTAWPVNMEDPSWRYAGYQPLHWAQFGVGEPQDYASLEDYIRESQIYQAVLCSYMINQFRLKKFQPCGGMIHFMFADCFPAITWAVLDYYRQPKLAYEAIKHAYAPTHIIVDWDGDWDFQNHYRLAFKPGSPLQLRFYVVNDSPYVAGETELRWTLQKVATVGSLLGVTHRAFSRTRSGVHRFTLPKTNETALLAGEWNDKPATGDYQLEVILRQGDRILEQMSLHYRVGKYPPHKAAKHKSRNKLHQAPSFMVNKLYIKGSLANEATGRGCRFELKNMIQNGALTGVLFLKIDGRGVPLTQTTIETEAGTLPASGISADTPLDMPVGRQVTIHIQDLQLSPGQHTLEIAVRVPGFGDALVEIKDTLAGS